MNHGGREAEPMADKSLYNNQHRGVECVIYITGLTKLKIFSKNNSAVLQVFI